MFSQLVDESLSTFIRPYKISGLRSIPFASTHDWLEARSLSFDLAADQ